MSFIPKNYYSKDELIACSNGKLFTKDGDGKLPSDQMLMFDEINRIDNDSGTYKKGSIEATLNINPDLWFFKYHFKVFDWLFPGLFLEVFRGGLWGNVRRALLGGFIDQLQTSFGFCQ